MRATVLLRCVLPLTGITLLLGGCPGPNPNPGGGSNKATVLKPFGSQSELVEYVRARATANGAGGFFRALDAAAPEAGGTNTAAGDQAAGGSGDDSFSTTNIQEAGVDESDVFKSDGAHFYLAKGRSLRVVRAHPQSELAEIGRLDLEQPIQALYLFEGKLIALAQDYGYPGIYDVGFAIPAIWPPYYSNGTTFVYEISIENPAQPSVIRKVELDGSLVNSRLTNGRLLLVLNVVPNLPAPFTILTPLAAEDILPRVRTSSGEDIAVNWSEIYRPDAPNGYFMTSVTTLDAANVESVLGAIAVMSNAGTIYASKNAIYVTDTDYDEANNYRETTSVHKFAYDDNGVARYVASGAVDGRLLNQFSLGEHDGYLRLATHIQGLSLISTGGGDVAVTDAARAQAADAAPPVPTNSVYVLGQKEGALEITGRIDGLAPDERLYSARFLGSRGYLVTFRQIDPLFALDLADPANPRVAGELKIPGFSDYLHPYGDKLLIGLGRSVAATPWGGMVTDRLQLSLFDVSDLANPRAVQQIQLGGNGSSSEANYNHKAFTFLPERGLLALPVTLTNDTYKPWFENNGVYVEPQYQTGVIALQVSETGFQSLGFLNDSGEPDKTNWWWPDWRRAAVINDTLYIASPLRVSATALSDFAAVSRIDLAPNPEDAGDGSTPGARGATERF